MGSGTGSGRVTMPRAKVIGDNGEKGYVQRDLYKFVKRIPFKEEGNGVWTIEHPAFGGGQILASTNMIFGWNDYEARVWDSDYNVDRMEKFGSLNEAKDWVKWKLASKFDPEKAR